MLALVGPTNAHAQAAAGHGPRAQAVAPNLYVLSQPSGNMVVLLSPDSSIVVGPQLPALVADARAVLAAHRVGSPRYVLVTPTADAAVYGDGGWGRVGAVVLCHEVLRRAMMQAPRRSSGAAVPGIGFSEVVQLSAGGNEVHVIRQRPGASGGDAVVHFENAETVYLGAVASTDGYPTLEPERGGSIDSMIETVKFFRRFPRNVHFVPGRGPVTTGQGLAEYGDMLVTVRDRVRRLRAAGRSEANVVAAAPTADLDARWGHGPISPAYFVAAVYRSLAHPPAVR